MGQANLPLKELLSKWECVGPPEEAKPLLEMIEQIPSRVHAASEAVKWEQRSDPDLHAVFLRCARMMEDMIRPMPASMLAPPTRQEIEIWYSRPQWEQQDLIRRAAKDFRTAAKFAAETSADLECSAAIMRMAIYIRGHVDGSEIKLWTTLLLVAAILLRIAPDVPQKDIDMLAIVVTLAIGLSRRDN